ncbi:MAG TPA: LPXTG cell wall anchor domain-containing protein, partial [Rhodoglobus sp.]|nr:LPXTG cell wall anchor domain-containing protein [Rhodoglobus sp.]
TFDRVGSPAGGPATVVDGVIVPGAGGGSELDRAGGGGGGYFGGAAGGYVNVPCTDPATYFYGAGGGGAGFLVADGALLGTSTSTGAGSLTITYLPPAVPEPTGPALAATGATPALPAAAALAVLGIGALLLLRRRRAA